MRVYFNLFAAASARAAGMQQSIRMCYYLANAGADVQLHICTRFFSSKKELLHFFGFEDLPNLDVRFHASPLSSRRDLHVFARPRGTRLHGFASYVWGALFHLRQVVSLALRRDRGGSDLVYLRGHRFPALYILLKRLLGLTAVYEIHEVSYLDDVPESEILTKKVMLDFERFSYRRADGIVFISQTLSDLVESRWGPVENSIVLPSGAKRSHAAPLPSGVELTKLYFVGNYYHFSGLDNVVRALAQLDPAVDLTIVGGGGPGDLDHDRLSELARHLGVADRIEFRGFVEPRDLPEVYAGAHILVMPHTGHIRSKYFVSPLKLFEYLGARRPIVASDLPTIREILEDGRNGVLVRPEDPEALAEGIRRVMGEEGLARRIAESAFETALTYSVAARGERLRRFFSKVSGDKERS